MIPYIVISNIAFALLFLGYVAFFKRLTFFRANRLYLIASMLFSLVVPLSDLTLPGVTSEAAYAITLPTIVVNMSNEVVLQPVVQTAFWTYWVGVILGMLLLLKGVYSIWSSHRRGKPEEDYLVAEGDHAFSFFSTIQIGATIDKQAREMILAHERVHRQELHSLDVLLFAMVRVFAWFNPFVHWAAKEVRLNHEYLVDQAMLRAFGRDYQHNLLNTAMGTTVFSLANSFYNTSLIKQRILMMNKHRTNKNASLTYVMALPLIAVAIWLNACAQDPMVQQNDVVQSKLNKEGQPSVYNAKEVDEMPKFEGGQEGMIAYFQANFQYPEVAKKEEVEGTVFVSFLVQSDGSLSEIQSQKADDDRLIASALKFVEAMPDWKPGIKDGKPVKVKMVLPIRYELQ